MKGGMNNIVRQAQQMQKKISKIQEEIGEKKIEASTGGGVVTAVVTGNQELVEIKIDPEVVDPDDVEMLQEMIIGAVNQAMKLADEMMNEEIEKVTGGMNIPGLF
ncbi:MAG: YbaB/EbfC family nucleoid-associated protein [Myxococcota bacterium]